MAQLKVGGNHCQSVKDIYNCNSFDQCDLKFSRSQAKIDENISNYFLKTKTNNYFISANMFIEGYRKV